MWHSSKHFEAMMFQNGDNLLLELIGAFFSRETESLRLLGSTVLFISLFPLVTLRVLLCVRHVVPVLTIFLHISYGRAWIVDSLVGILDVSVL